MTGNELRRNVCDIIKAGKWRTEVKAMLEWHIHLAGVDEDLAALLGGV